MINNLKISQLTAKIGSLALASSLISLGIATSAQALSTGISSFSGGSEFGGNNTRGFRFRATEDLTVRALGVYDIGLDGITSSGVDVGLWDDNGMLLGEVLVPGGTMAPILDDFRYEFLGTSINLTTGNFYRVGADLSDISDSQDYIANAVPTTLNGIDSIQEVLSAVNSGFEFPSTISNPNQNQAFLGGNILIEDSVPVPFEVDATLGLLLVGGLFAGNKMYRNLKK